MTAGHGSAQPQGGPCLTASCSMIALQLGPQCKAEDVVLARMRSAVCIEPDIVALHAVRAMHRRCPDCRIEERHGQQMRATDT